MTNEPVGNWTWQAMEPSDKDVLRPHLQLCHLPQGDVLMHAGDAVDVVYFPVSAEIANVIRYSDGKTAVAATVSRNGLTGLAAFLAEEPLGWDLCVQIGGQAWRMPSDVLRRQCRESPELTSLLMTLTHENQVEASVNAACHLRHDLTSRMARWLLTTQERTGQSELPVKQGDLAEWMGVQRTSVVASSRFLANHEAIQNRRGRLKIINREVLKAHACECYGRVARRLDAHPDAGDKRPAGPPDAAA
jgi:CRP-like cAMP-binding protein